MHLCIPPIFGQPCRKSQLVFVRRKTPIEKRIGSRVALADFHFFVWNAGEIKDNECRNLPCEIRHEISVTASDEAVDVGFTIVANARFQSPNFLRRERGY